MAAFQLSAGVLATLRISTKNPRRKSRRMTPPCPALLSPDNQLRRHQEGANKDNEANHPAVAALIVAGAHGTGKAWRRAYPVQATSGLSHINSVFGLNNVCTCSRDLRAEDEISSARCTGSIRGANMGNCREVVGQEARSKNARADSLACNGGGALGRWGIAARFRLLARLLRERRAAYTIPFAAGRKLSAKL